MRGKLTWLVLAATGAVALVAAIDALRGSHSRSEPEPLAQARDGPSSPTTSAQTTTGPPDPTGQAMMATPTVPAMTEPAVTDPATERGTTTDSAGAASESAVPAATSPERLPPCATAQLRLGFTVTDGLAALVLARVAGNPCHQGRSRVSVVLRDLSGHRVPVFGGSETSTAPADFSERFAQLVEIPQASCDPADSFLVVGTVGRYTARRTFPGTQLPCNHG